MQCCFNRPNNTLRENGNNYWLQSHNMGSYIMTGEFILRVDLKDNYTD